MRRIVVSAAVIVVLAAAVVVDRQDTAHAPSAPGTIVATPIQGSGYTGQDLLAQLRIAPEDTAAYDPAVWNGQHQPGCDLRAAVLREFGTGDVHGTGCDPACPTVACWTSNYDNVHTSDAGQLVLDRRVSAQEAHRSGAAAWSDARRAEFLDDAENFAPTTAVTAHAHDGRDAAHWQPVEAWQCFYALPYAQTKIDWDLTVDQAEFDALASMFTWCP
ncbi:hypothetical protein JNUCC0626_50005 (plasmid) [Lentzea sp. JNUCC 0626]|uniref:hypothetical protein n=1 Tax=Lentzea sp. JNUCC 0626 TaxID=3367513 RepID=UPI0037484C10